MQRRIPKILYKTGLVMLGLAFLLTASCGSYEKSKQARAQLAARGRGPVYIAIVWPKASRQYPMIEGVSLAVDELNRSGGVLGREVKTLLFEEAPDKVRDIARDIADNTEIVAVVGHISSTSAIKASIIYEESGILFLAPSATNPVLTAHGFDYVFRTTPSDILIGQELAVFSREKGYRRVLILDDNSIYGAGLATTYHAAAADQDIAIVGHKAYFPWQFDYKSLAGQFTNSDLDALFLAGEMPAAARLIQQFRAMGIDVPIISGDSLDTMTLPALAGAAADGTVVPTFFYAGSDAPVVRHFIEAFKARYHSDPGRWDALGYDTLKLLAHAFETCGTTVPIVAASTLRVTKHWQGVTGDFTFDAAGDLTQKRLYFKEVKNGHFEHIKE